MKICLSCEGVTSTPAQRCGHCGAWLVPTDSVHYPVRRGEADAGNPLLGTIIDGKYRLQAVLGRGGLGTVFRAQHIGSLLTVALKLLNPRFAARPEYRRALVPEARRAATVTNDHCSRLLDVGDAEGGVAYLAMELVEGATLEAIVQAGRLPPSQAIDVLLQVAEALEAIHAAGLVHNDLSPRNVMVAARNGALQVKVLDFGIARSVRLAEGGPAQVDLAGFVNPAFSAPEVLTAGEVDARADLYSFGTLAWYLLTATLPIDASEPRAAAAAVAAGQLHAWPAVPGVPRRLLRLLQRCLLLDPAQRPPSAAAVHRELMVIRRAAQPLVTRGALLAAAAAAVLAFAGGSEPPAPFLRPVSSSALELATSTLPPAAKVQELRSARLVRLGFHFGGFAARRMRADLTRNGEVLTSIALRPVVDAASGTLELATVQPEWSDVVQALRSQGRDGPVDLTFVVPGMAPLGAARVRIDDDPPELRAQLQGHDAGDGPGDGGDAVVLHAGSTLDWAVQDASSAVVVEAVVQFAGGRGQALPLAGRDGRFALGKELARLLGTTADLGAGEVVVRARDTAGNERRLPPLPFARADVAAPGLLELRGGGGESFLPSTAGVLRLRLRLAAEEAGCRLVLAVVDGGPTTTAPLLATRSWQTVEAALPVPKGALLRCVVIDELGNRGEPELVMPVRDQDLRVEFVGERGAVQVGAELVLASAGGSVLASVGDGLRLDAARVELAGATTPGQPTSPVSITPVVDRTRRCTFHRLPPGLHTLRLEVSGRDGDPAPPAPTVPLRVLPDTIELRLPAPGSRFLPGLLAAGTLAARGGGLVDGPGWRLDPALRRYVRGTLWLGERCDVALSLPAGLDAAAPLLPEVQPVPGHNLLTANLRDVLDRPLRVLVGDATRRHRCGDRELDVLADFWWSEVTPAVIGEEVPVEFGQPARCRVRLPLPYTDADRADLRLGILAAEVPASRVDADGEDRAIALFEIDAAIWSVAAGLVGHSREEFAAQLERTVPAYLATPAAAGGRDALELHLRTVRSTLQPITLGELAELPAPLDTMRLLPVLAPDQPFAEPVPAGAPPRPSFRPQVAVAVRNLPDLLLQREEFTWGEARAVVAAFLARDPAAVAGLSLVHHDDPLGRDRLLAANLLPPAPAGTTDTMSVCGVSFFQAYTLARLLGLLVAGDAEACRLPLGCELELAAYAGATTPACSGAVAGGGTVTVAGFLLSGRASATTARSMGDVVPTRFGEPFVGLDFGVREWVLDLPHVDGGEMLLRELIRDHEVHLGRALAIARGEQTALTDPIGPVRQLGVVRGLASGERDGLIDDTGDRLDVFTTTTLPAAVPGVLRTLQLPRDGRDPLGGGRDPRLAGIGFRVVGDANVLTRLRGRR